MQIIFFGTPYYILPILEALHKDFKAHGVSPIEAVVTQPPRPSGRKQILEYSPVDTWAHKKSIPTYFDANELIKNKVMADVGILASYGALIPEEVIKSFKYGILVVHPSILPEFRGSAPVPAMFVTNAKKVGTTIFKMDEKWDHGPIVTQFTDELREGDNYQVLRDRLFERSAEVLVQALPAYLSGRIRLKPQNEKEASFARMIKTQDAFIPPSYIDITVNGKPTTSTWKIDFIKASGKPYELEITPQNIHNFIRGMTPRPGAWTTVTLEQSTSSKTQKRLKILKTHVQNVGSGNEFLSLDEVQLEGRNKVTWNQFKLGYPKFKFEG